MAPYPIFFKALKTIIMPSFMLLTESEQLKRISALLQVFLCILSLYISFMTGLPLSDIVRMNLAQ